MGDDPPAFDVLFWNADATNLSATLMGDFLTLFETLAFTRPGEVEMDLTKDGKFERSDDWSSCAYLYLDAPERRLPPLLSLEKRIEGL